MLLCPDTTRLLLLWGEGLYQADELISEEQAQVLPAEHTRSPCSALLTLMRTDTLVCFVPTCCFSQCWDIPAPRQSPTLSHCT